MKKYRFFAVLVSCFFVQLTAAQEEKLEEVEGIGEEQTVEQVELIPVTIDSLYREDQFYFGLTFNLIGNKPSTISQSSFSGGLHLGFIRDFPLNKQRNIAIGAGLGWSMNTYGHNLFIGENENDESIFRSLDEENTPYSTNRFSTYLIEAPIEFRWRTSTAEEYNFWRIYTGLRLGYIYHFRTNFVQEGNTVVQTNVPELNRFRLGTTFTFGYSTFNFQLYYSLNSLFEEANLMKSGENIGISTIKVGLMFYIL